MPVIQTRVTGPPASSLLPHLHCPGLLLEFGAGGLIAASRLGGLPIPASRLRGSPFQHPLADKRLYCILHHAAFPKVFAGGFCPFLSSLMGGSWSPISTYQSGSGWGMGNGAREVRMRRGVSLPQSTHQGPSHLPQPLRNTPIIFTHVEPEGPGNWPPGMHSDPILQGGRRPCFPPLGPQH